MICFEIPIENMKAGYFFINLCSPEIIHKCYVKSALWLLEYSRYLIMRSFCIRVCVHLKPPYTNDVTFWPIFQVAIAQFSAMFKFRDRVWQKLIIIIMNHC